MALITDQMRRALYIAASNALHPSLRKEKEHIKDYRDETIRHLYPKVVNQNQLTLAQAERVLSELKSIASGITRNEALLETKHRLKTKIMALGIQFALIKFDFRTYTVNVDKIKKRILTGEPLREFCQREFLKGELDWNIRMYLFNEFMNPHLHKYLVEGGFKKGTKNPHSFYWDNYTNEELQYLVTRLQEIVNTYQHKINVNSYMLEVN